MRPTVSLSALACSALFLPAAVWAAEYPSFANISNTEIHADNLQAVDLDGDGDLDLIGTGLIDPSDSTRKVLWWENAGKGAYVKRGEWQPDKLSLLAVEDFDGDGIPDLLVEWFLNSKFQIAICHGQGLTGFAAPGASTEMPDATVVVHDVNGDGLSDLISSAGIWLNQGDGTFKRAAGLNPPLDLFSSSPVVWGDANGDGLPDLFIGGNGVSLVLNQGDTGFGTAQPIYTVPENSGEFAALGQRTWAFFQHPQLGPCVIFPQLNQDSSKGTLKLLVQKSGAWEVVATLPLPRVKGYDGLGTIDVVPDGDKVRILTDKLHPGRRKGDVKLSPDYSTIGEIGIKVARSGAVSLTWKDILRYTGPSARPALGDVNGDGRKDLILSVTPYPVSAFFPLDQIQWFAGLGSGSFTPKPNFVTGLALAGEVAYVGDIDGDGDQDVITDAGQTSGGISAVCLWRNSNHGQSFSQELIYSKGTFSKVLKVDDHGGKGRPEIIIGNYELSASGAAQNAQVISLIPGPRGTFTQKVLYRSKGVVFPTTQWIDGDGDGIPDIKGIGADENSWAKGLPGNRFRQPKPQELAKFVTTGQTYLDIDWDGDSDLWSSDHWLENNGSASWVSHTIPNGQTVTLNGAPVTLGEIQPAGVDFNGDGHPDWFTARGQSVIPLLAKGNGDPSNPAYPIDPNTVVGPAIDLFKSATFYDLTGDGLPDAIYNTVDTLGTQTFMRENLGNGAFGEEKKIGGLSIPWRTAAMTGDLDGNGILDVITVNKLSNLEWAAGVQAP